MKEIIAIWMAFILLIVVWAIILMVITGCAPMGQVRYEEDSQYYPYYRPAQNHSGEIGFVPKGNGVIVGGPRDGGIVHNDKIYNTDGSIEFRR